MNGSTLISEKLLAWIWKLLLIMAVAIPIVATVFFWYQNKFETPMPRAVLDSATSNPIVFSAFIALIALSFGVQYFLGSPATRKHEIRLRTPILVFIGPIIIIVISVLAWWQSNASFASTVSKIAQKPWMLGSVVGFTGGSLILAFLMSPRNLQKRCLRVLITLGSVFLMFGGPTYLMYGLQAVKAPYYVATLTGLVSFIAGIIIFLRFVPKETEG